MKRKVITIVMIIMLIFSFSGLTYAADNISINLDGSVLEMDADPVNVQGRVLVPMRAIFEAMGATVEWDQDNKIINATKGLMKIKLQIGIPEIEVNSVKTQLDVAPALINNKTMVPVRAVAEGLNATVGWDNGNKQVLIISCKDGYPEYDYIPDFGILFDCKAKDRALLDENIIAYKYSTNLAPSNAVELYSNNLMELGFKYVAGSKAENDGGSMLFFEHNTKNILIAVGRSVNDYIVSINIPTK